MEDFNSKYTGKEVEQLLDQVANGGNTGGGSSLANVQAVETIEDDVWKGEVRPIRDAKDLTTGEKVYFVGHANSIFTYNGSALQDELDDIRTTLVPFHLEVESTEESGEIPIEFIMSMVSGGISILNGGIASWNADQSIITSIKSTENILTITKIYIDIYSTNSYEKITIDEYDLDNLGSGESGTETDPIFSASPAATITEEKIAEWNGKQDTISDLDTIRNGASAGATALQSVPSEYVTETELAEAIASAITNTLNTAV